MDPKEVYLVKEIKLHLFFMNPQITMTNSKLSQFLQVFHIYHLTIK